MSEFTLPDGFTVEAVCVDCDASALVLKPCMVCGRPMCAECLPVCVDCGDAIDDEATI